jgi:hypothetical protein
MKYTQRIMDPGLAFYRSRPIDVKKAGRIPKSIWN